METRIYDIGIGGGEACVLSKDGRRIWLPDGIATATDLIVKADLNADYDYADANETLAVNTHFWVGPYNAQNGSEPKPYEWLELVPNNSSVTVWPRQVRAVSVTAIFGWPEVPTAIKELTIALTRYLRDIIESGMTFALNAIDQAVSESRQMSFFLRDIERMYARPPSF